MQLPSAQATVTVQIKVKTLAGGYGSQGLVSIDWARAAGPKAIKVATISSPTFMVKSKSSDVLYVTSELGSQKANLLSYTKAGKLLSKVSSGAQSPVRLAVSPSGSTLAVANYSGSFATFNLDAKGAIGKRTGFVKFASPSQVHSVAYTPNGRWLIVADKGRALVLFYDMSKKSGQLLNPVTVKAESARQALAISNSEVIVVSERTGQIYRLLLKKNQWQVREVVESAHRLLAEVTQIPGTRNIVVQARSSGTCDVFSIDGLKLIQSFACGSKPRYGTFSADGRTYFVAAQKDNAILAFHYLNGNFDLKSRTALAGAAVLVEMG